MRRVMEGTRGWLGDGGNEINLGMPWGIDRQWQGHWGTLGFFLMSWKAMRMGAHGPMGTMMKGVKGCQNWLLRAPRRVMRDDNQRGKWREQQGHQNIYFYFFCWWRALDMSKRMLNTLGWVKFENENLINIS